MAEEKAKAEQELLLQPVIDQLRESAEEGEAPIDVFNRLIEAAKAEGVTETQAAADTALAEVKKAAEEAIEAAKTGKPPKGGPRAAALARVGKLKVKIADGEIRGVASSTEGNTYQACHEAKLDGLQSYEMATIGDLAGRMAQASFDPRAFAGVDVLPPYTKDMRMLVTVAILEAKEEG